MKRIIISAAIAMSAAAAYAEPVTVMTPKAGASIAEQQAYVAELDSAVENVCKKENAPIYGVAFYSYKACLKETRLQVSRPQNSEYRTPGAIAPGVFVGFCEGGAD